MIETMDTATAEMCWEPLEKVLHLLTYAQRAIQQLKAEFWRARNAEALKDQSLEKVREALAEADATVEATAPTLEKFWR